MNIAQLEGMLEVIKLLWQLAEDAPLGVNSIKDDLTTLESSIEDALMKLLYEKYKEDREIEG